MIQLLNILHEIKPKVVDVKFSGQCQLAPKLKTKFMSMLFRQVQRVNSKTNK